ncbi:DUF6732 family protein [Polycladidibacter hongkongensis]|uniref:DUF6732 family protein n=1 Tax=Polycladidibacter hongkongensis TaxID=1647556 RepID=UPI000834F9F8|nr:DUF6732 family protein [Pseudovibrio hongkongensis]
MSFSSRAFLSCVFTTLPTVAFAHGGHIGELAGHAHWVGAAALAGAAILAGLVARERKKTKQQEVEETAEDTAATPEAGEAEAV